jgi:hypothetical protein
MAWRFRKSIKILPGVKLNFGKRGVSTTIGRRGLSVNVSKRGTFLNTGIPGTGMSSRQRISGPISTNSAPADSPIAISDANLSDEGRIAQSQSSVRPTSKVNVVAVLAWIAAPIFLLIGISSLAVRDGDSLGGIMALLLGLLLVPPLNRMLRRVSHGRLTRPVTGGLAFCLLAVWMFSGVQEAAKEKARVDRLAAIEAKVDAERAARRARFLREYPFVRSASYDTWVASAKDSSTKSELTVAGFVAAEKVAHIAALRKERADSLARAKVERAQLAAARREAAAAAASERRERARIVEANRPTYVNGHEIHVGPRGGRYYINGNGNKTYVD